MNTEVKQSIEQPVSASTSRPSDNGHRKSHLPNKRVHKRRRRAGIQSSSEESDSDDNSTVNSSDDEQATVAPAEVFGDDETRQRFVEQLTKALDNAPEALAKQIEKQVYKQFSAVDDEYKAKLRWLINDLRTHKQRKAQLLKGDLSPGKLVKMSFKDLAAADDQAARKQAAIAAAHDTTDTCTTLQSQAGSPPLMWPATTDSGKAFVINNNVESRDHFPSVRELSLYFVDKSMLIYEFLQKSSGPDTPDPPRMSLLLRPRRFGKTLNASMICSFVGPEADRALFRGLAIDKYPEFVNKHLGQYPCIHISLHKCLALYWDSHLGLVRQEIAELYKQHRQLLLPYLKAADTLLYQRLLAMTSAESELSNSLLSLTKWYYQIYQRRSVIIMDEYDQGMQAAIEGVLAQRVNNDSEYKWDTYQRFADFYRVLLTSTFKGNSYMFRGLLVGVSRVARTGMLSGFNNIQVLPLHSDVFHDKYGFTEQEVHKLWSDFQLQRHGITMGQLKDLYNGYDAGSDASLAVYNPWSIMTMAGSRKAKADYWSATGSLQIVQHIFIAGKNHDFRTQLSQLVNHGTITGVNINEDIDYRKFAKSNPPAVWSLLYHAGYLKRDTAAGETATTAACLRLTNEEMAMHLTTSLATWYHDSIEDNKFDQTSVITQLLAGDVAGFSRSFVDALELCASYFDFPRDSKEQLYHVYALGLLIGALQRGYICIESNREAGYGRFDLMVKPAASDKGYRAVIIEFKVSRSETDVDDDATSALEQIVHRKYAQQVPAWCTNMDHYGISFHRKTSRVLCRTYVRGSDGHSEWIEVAS